MYQTPKHHITKDSHIFCGTGGGREEMRGEGVGGGGGGVAAAAAAVKRKYMY